MVSAVRLVIWIPLVCSSLAAGQGQPAGGNESQATVTLTASHPSASFPVAAQTVAAAPPVLAVRVTKVVNPEKNPFGIFIFLSAPPGARAEQEARSNKPVKFQIGQFSLFPADRPAGFTFRASLAFARLKKANPKSGEVRLLFEMKPLRKAETLRHVEVTIAQPDWWTVSSIK